MLTLTKFTHPTYETPGDPTSGVRSECWGAMTDDRAWLIQRLEEPGTPWVVTNVPLRLEVGQFSSMDACVVFLADEARVNEAFGEAVRRAARLEAECVLIRRAGGRPDFYDQTPDWLKTAATEILAAQVDA